MVEGYKPVPEQIVQKEIPKTNLEAVSKPLFPEGAVIMDARRAMRRTRPISR